MPRRNLCDQVRLSVLLTFILSLMQVYCNSNQPISLKLGVMIGLYQSEQLITHTIQSLTLGRDPIMDTDSGSILHPADFHDTRRNDWRLQDTESTFWDRSNRHPDPNPGNLVSNLGSLLVILAWAEVCALCVL